MLEGSDAGRGKGVYRCKPGNTDAPQVPLRDASQTEPGVPAPLKVGTVNTARPLGGSNAVHYIAEILSHICRSSRSGSLICRVSELNTITGRCDSLYGLQAGILE